MLGRCRSVDIFEKLNPIGEGTYGRVYRARNKETNEIVALKKVHLHQSSMGKLEVSIVNFTSFSVKLGAR